MLKKYDVVGIGSPLLDFIVEVSEERLAEIGLTKGTMRLIDLEESARLLKLLTEDEMMIAPGGSAANTISGASALGATTAFLGKIGNDGHGRTYIAQTKESGVASLLSLDRELATGHAITFVTPDGERTFATHLGASQGFSKTDVSDEEIAQSQYLHLEGYQLADPLSLQALEHAVAVAKASGTRVSIDLSDAGVISRNMDLVQRVLNESIDMVFVNELEAEALTGQKNMEDAVDTISNMCPIAVVKVGGGGSFIKTNGTVERIPVFATTVVNTTGAGDMYAGGVLYGLTHGASTKDAGHIGSFAASRVVAQKEARLNALGQIAVRDYVAGLNV